MIKPKKLNTGDTIATISPCWGASGDIDIVWKYEIGKKRLQEISLKVVSAPNSQKGTSYLQANPKARAEDFQWAFENNDIKAIIANIGGNDSDRVLPYLNSKIIKNNPKIFIGYSDVMSYHLYCYKAGLSTFYGPNLLPTVAETPNFHPYSKKWFKNVLFNNSVIGEIEPSTTYSCDENNYIDKSYIKKYKPESGYLWLQGEGVVSGKLFGGHTGIRDYNLSAEDFEDKILFIEDIPEFFNPKQLADFIDWLGCIGALKKIKGILIGKLCEDISFDNHKKALLEIINYKYGEKELPIIANMNFGHSSPMCILPYGAKAEINSDTKRFSILESGVL